MLMKQLKNLVPKISVLIIIFILLATAAGCASSSSADSPGTSAQDEASQSSENPEPVATDQDPEQAGSTVPDEPSGSPEKAEPDKDVDPGEEDEPDQDNEHAESDGPSISAEQAAMARELGLIVFEEEIEAPVFTLPTLEGSEITLSDLRGRFVVINFWTTKCPPCVAEMDYFEAAARKYPDELTILTVDIRESESKVSEFFGDDERTFMAVLDKTGEVTSIYGIRYTPTTFFLDAEGNVPYAKVGAFASQQQFEDCVALLLELA